MKIDLPAPYAMATLDGAILIARSDARAPARAALEQAGSLFAFAAARRGAQPLAGRGVAYSIPAPDGRWVVRHYRRGGAMTWLFRDRYVRWGVARPVQEVLTSHAVRARGIDSPEVVAAAIYPSGAVYRADLATRHVPDSIDLATMLFGPEPTTPEDRVLACAAAGRLVRRLHERGIVQPDLNLKNVLLQWTTRPPRAYLLDLDRCRVVDRVSARQRAAMLGRFWRSLRKWERRTGLRLEPAGREAFERACRRRDG